MKTTKPKIRRAAEVASTEKRMRANADDKYCQSVQRFIENVIMPRIEAFLDEPEKFTTAGLVSERIPSPLYPADRFVSVVGSILTPLGYRVAQSHDGGGMYDTVVVRWDQEKPSKNTLKGDVAAIEEGLEQLGNNDGYSEALDRAKQMVSDLLELVTPAQRAKFMTDYDDVVQAGVEDDGSD